MKNAFDDNKIPADTSFVLYFLMLIKSPSSYHIKIKEKKYFKKAKAENLLLDTQNQYQLYSS